MVVLRHLGLGRRRLPPEVAANSGQIAVIAVTTAPVGATSLLRTAQFALEPSTPVPLRHRAMVMRQPQCRFLQHHQRRLRHHRYHHRCHHRSQRRRQDHSQQSIATRTQLRHSCAQVALCAPTVAATLALARDAGVSEA